MFKAILGFMKLTLTYKRNDNPRTDNPRTLKIANGLAGHDIWAHATGMYEMNLPYIPEFKHYKCSIFFDEA